MIGTAGRMRTLLASALLSAMLAGCSDGVEIKSPLLNTVVGSLGVGQKKEPQLTDRPGLVIPPPMAALPEPGTGVAVAAQVSAQLPQGPEQQAAAAAADQKKQAAEACVKAAQNRKDAELQAACPGLIKRMSQTDDGTAQ